MAIKVIFAVCEIFLSLQMYIVIRATFKHYIMQCQTYVRQIMNNAVHNVFQVYGNLKKTQYITNMNVIDWNNKN